MWYMVRNLCAVTIDSVLVNSKTERFLIPGPRHVSSRLLPSGETCQYTKASVTQTYLDRFSLPIHMLLPAVCVLVVAQPGVEVAEGLTNYSVYASRQMDGQGDVSKRSAGDVNARKHCT